MKVKLTDICIFQSWYIIKKFKIIPITWKCVQENLAIKWWLWYLFQEVTWEYGSKTTLTACPQKVISGHICAVKCLKGRTWFSFNEEKRNIYLELSVRYVNVSSVRLNRWAKKKQRLEDWNEATASALRRFHLKALTSSPLRSAA